MKRLSNKIIVLVLLIALSPAIYYLFSINVETKNIVSDANRVKQPEVSVGKGGLEQGGASQNTTKSVTASDKKSYYKSLLVEKGSPAIVQTNKFPLNELYSDIDEGLADEDAAIQIYSLVLLRQYSIYHPDDVNAYFNGTNYRKMTIVKMLESDISDVQVNAFSILAATSIGDDAVEERLIDAINNSDNRIGKMEMLRELGRHSEKFTATINDSLVNMVTGYKPGTDDPAIMLDAALIMSRYKEDKPKEIFPNICVTYESEFYESSVMINILENYAESGIGCPDEMRRIVSMLGAGQSSQSAEPSTALIINRTQQVLNVLDGK